MNGITRTTGYKKIETFTSYLRGNDENRDMICTDTDPLH